MWGKKYAIPKERGRFLQLIREVYNSIENKNKKINSKKNVEGHKQLIYGYKNSKYGSYTHEKISNLFLRETDIEA